MSAEQGSNTPAGEGEKVRVRGRIGQVPQFRTVPDRNDPTKELLIGNFSIAEHPDEADRNVTVWHEVATFGERSRRLQEHFGNGELRVGQEVEVVGTLHRRERPTKEGGTKTVEQIYAYAIKPVEDKTQDTAGPSNLQTPPGSWE